MNLGNLIDVYHFENTDYFSNCTAREFSYIYVGYGFRMQEVNIEDLHPVPDDSTFSYNQAISYTDFLTFLSSHYFFPNTLLIFKEDVVSVDQKNKTIKVSRPANLAELIGPLTSVNISEIRKLFGNHLIHQFASFDRHKIVFPQDYTVQSVCKIFDIIFKPYEKATTHNKDKYLKSEEDLARTGNLSKYFDDLSKIIRNNS